MTCYSSVGSPETGRVAPWVVPGRTSEVGPPSPVRRSKSGESGEWVTEPAARAPPTATGPVRLTHRPFMNGAGAGQAGSIPTISLNRPKPM